MQNRLDTIRTRTLLLLIAAVIAVVVLGNAGDALSQQDAAGTENPLSLDLTLSPWATTPGDMVSLILSMRNNGATASMPDVSIQLPEQVNPDVSTLPSGTIYNFQSGGLSWQPYIEPYGGVSQIELWLSVTVAQMKEPERTVTASVRSNGVEWSQATTLWIGSLPQAYIAFDPPQVSVGQPVKLITHATGPGPLTQIWSMDDGRVIAANDPVVVFASTGSHVVTLQISNPLGTTSISSQVEVFPQPISRFSIEDNSSIAESAVAFMNQSGGEPPLSYTWDFGDGAISNEKSPVHEYSVPGVYQVNLRVENAYGRSETYSFVDIGVPPTLDILFAEFEEAGSVLHGQVIADKTTTEIIWDMGDGRRYTGANISHIYWLPGDYVLMVTARNDFGETRVFRRIHIGYGILKYYIPYLTIGGSSDLALSTGLELGLASGAIDVGLGPQPELLPIEFASGTTQAEQVFIYINEARSLYNLRPLSYVHSLSVAAQAHTDDMAAYGYTAHLGSNGSTPAYRLQVAGYTGGYGGEATAWGMSDPIEPVQYWLTSPAHRVILLNPAVSEVGVGFTADYNAPNVWYWTAEFASLHLPVVGASPPQAPTPVSSPELLLLGPPQSSEFILSEGAKLIFSWSWGGGIQENQRFALYLSSGGRTFQAGVIRQPQASGQYQFSVDASSVAITQGSYSWQIKLEDSEQGLVVAESPIWQVHFVTANQGVFEPTPTETVDVTPEPTPSLPPPAEPTSVQIPLPVSTPVPTVVP
ncbi:MAG: PKD domain-containing protein [Candidatus Promineifilaceae bacterium]